MWDPNGDARQTIRAGVGHYFDSPKLWQYAHHMLNAPYGNTTNAQPATSCGVPNRNGCPIVFSDPWRFTPGGDPMAGRARQGDPQLPIPTDSRFPQQGEYVSMPIDVEPMQVTQWDMSYERQFLGRMKVEISYMGSQTSNIWLGYEENPAIYVPGNCAPGQYPA